MRTGQSYVLGRHVDGGFATWDQTVPQPVARYGPGDWARANTDLDTAEKAPAQFAAPTSAAHSYAGLIPLVVLVLFVAAVYVWYHAHRYSGCVVAPPGIFDWPSACL